MPFAALAKIAAPLIAKAAPKVLPAVQKVAQSVLPQVLPKILPQNRTVLGTVAKAMGVAGASTGIGMFGGSLYNAATTQTNVTYSGTVDYGPTPILQAPPLTGAGMGPLLRMAGRGRAVPGGAAAGTAAGGAVLRAGELIYTAAGRLSGLVDQFMRKWSVRRVAALARRLGPEAAAAALGVGMAVVLQMVAQDASRVVRRRRRGISWGQLNTTRKTLRKFDTMNKYLCRPTTAKRRSVCR